METRLLLLTDLHLCHIAWYGLAPEERLARMVAQVSRNVEEFHPDALLMLGDYSLDFWQWDIGGSFLHDPPVSNTARFMRDFVSRLPIAPYLIPGNHEQYGNEAWRAITGRDRQYRVRCGGVEILMLDTFAGELDPTVNSDGCYTGPDAALIREALKEREGRKLILCGHDFDPAQDDPAVRALIAGEDAILALFAGHTHVAEVETYEGKPLLRCGQFSYARGSVKDTPWGMREVVITDRTLDSVYRVYENTLCVDGVTYTQPPSRIKGIHLDV